MTDTSNNATGKRLYIVTYGWPYASALQYALFVLFSCRLIRLWRKDSIIFRRRAWGSVLPYLACYRSACCGQQASLGAPLGRGFELLRKRVRFGFSCLANFAPKVFIRTFGYQMDVAKTDYGEDSRGYFKIGLAKRYINSV